jgi:hypothetical protein
MKNFFYLISLFFFCNVIYSANTSSSFNNTLPLNTTNLKCDTCKLSINLVENYLQNNHTLTELEQILDNLCDKTPISNECTQLVNEYLPSIINLIEKEETPDEICSQINFCNSTKI